MSKHYPIVAVFAFFVLTRSAGAQTIQAAEYYINSDPGPGNGTTITVTPGQTIDTAVDMPVATIAALPDGPNLLVCRVQDADGDWSIAFARAFSKSNVTFDGTVPDIAAAEYYFDSDLGPGNGTPIAVTPATSVDLSVDIPAGMIAALSAGIHLLVARVQDADGDWSVAFARAFSKSNVTFDGTVPNITAAEYYFDSDPGPGNGTPIPVTPATSVDLFVDIPAGMIAGLSDGIHLLVARVKDEDDDWSIAFARAFRKSNVTFDGTVPDITAAEHYFDSDPGPGNGTPIAVTPATSVDLFVDIPAGMIAALSDGIHLLVARVQDDDGDWSVAFARVFRKAEDPPPPATVLMARIDYQWLVGGAPVGNVISLIPAVPAKAIMFQELASLEDLQEDHTAVLMTTPYDTLGNQGIPGFATVQIQTEDSDGDGVPDYWEELYGFNTNDDTDMALDSDGDGLDNENEFIAGTNPLSDDTDSDGMNDSAEVLLAAFGFDPTVDNAALRDSLYAAAVGAGLYSESQVRNLNMLVPLIGRDPTTGDIIVRFRVQKTSELLNDDWSQFVLTPTNTAIDSGDLLIEIPVTGEDTLFIRILADESLQFQ